MGKEADQKQRDEKRWEVEMKLEPAVDAAAAESRL